jgi:hypothetical protein
MRPSYLQTKYIPPSKSLCEIRVETDLGYSYAFQVCNKVFIRVSLGDVFHSNGS